MSRVVLRLAAALKHESVQSSRWIRLGVAWLKNTGLAGGGQAASRLECNPHLYQPAHTRNIKFALSVCPRKSNTVT